MEPILTLPYSEWIVAEQLMRLLRPSQGYSVYAPLSRQEKGVDLLVSRRANGQTRATTIQVKYSRAYEQRAGHNFGIWFKVFEVPDQADFIVLAALYPNTNGRGGGRRSSWWSSLLLLFTSTEMRAFLSSLRTRGGKPERMFAFGFSSPEQVVLIRGTQDREQTDFTKHLLSSRVNILESRLSAG